jgi:predicted DCC family thiol-disulfide oxidoreductase YuxK
LKIFYDGSCCICSGEMHVYMKKNHGGRLVFVDISEPDFNPDQYGISLADFMYQMHAIDRSGRLYRGVDAFWAIWQAFPASPWYGLLGTLISTPGMRLFARTAYRAFAITRKYLPKRRNGVCRIGKHPPP